MRKDIDAHHRAYILAQDIEKWAKDTVHKEFYLGSIKLDWSPKRTASRGGIYKNGPGINIAMAYAYPNNREEVYRFYEYKSYDSNAVIGGFYSKDPYDKLRAVVCHEMAHAIQFFHYSKSGIRCKPHGPVFKSYYKALREEFVNNNLPDQDTMGKEYLEYTAKLNAGVQYVISSLLNSQT